MNPGAYHVFFFVGNVYIYTHTQAKSAELQAHAAKLKKEKAKLQESIAELKQMIAAEQAARKAALVCM